MEFCNDEYSAIFQYLGHNFVKLLEVQKCNFYIYKSQCPSFRKNFVDFYLFIYIFWFGEPTELLHNSDLFVLLVLRVNCGQAPENYKF